MTNPAPRARTGPTSLLPPSPDWRARAVVFDFDGLMFNTEELYEHVGAEVLRRRGKTFDLELMHAMMGRPPAVALQLMIDWHGLSDTVEQLAADSAGVFAEILEQRLAFMPGAEALFAALDAAALPKAIATSSYRYFVDHVLGLAQPRTRFEFILTCEDVTDGKPHPEIYLSAARRFGVAPGEMVVFEDSHHGCRAAVAAGACAVAVPAGHSQTHDFTGAALVADTLADPRIYRLLRLAGPPEQ